MSYTLDINSGGCIVLLDDIKCIIGLPVAPYSDKKEEQSIAKGNAKTSNGSKPVFKIQFLTAGRKLANNDRRLSGLPNVDYYVENGTYKYTCGASTDYNKVKATLKDVTKRYKDAFIIAFKEEKKMNVNDAIKEFSANK